MAGTNLAALFMANTKAHLVRKRNKHRPAEDTPLWIPVPGALGDEPGMVRGRPHDTLGFRETNGHAVRNLDLQAPRPSRQARSFDTLEIRTLPPVFRIYFRGEGLRTGSVLLRVERH